MAVLDINFDRSKRENGSELNELEQARARIIGALMALAKSTQIVAVCMETNNPERSAQASVDMLLTVANLYQGDGKRMEREVLQLAHDLGFEIEQRYIAKPAGGVH
jgi:hypothetical protein